MAAALKNVPRRWMLAGLGVVAGLTALVAQESPYDPLATARRELQVHNPEAQVPPQCYTRTEGTHNPCYTCHTRGRAPNYRVDWSLQEEYAFSLFARRNRWRNLHAPPPPVAISEEALLAHVRADNYTPLVRALAAREDYRGFRPDLDFAQGFDDDGFARDGSGWRALRYKPFPGTFWPTNGRGGDVMVRLPARFREQDGKPSRAVYIENLALLEAAIAADPRKDDAELALPEHFTGDAASVSLVRYEYPEGVEFLHTLRYLDPDAPSMLGRRMQELRYSRKVHRLDHWGTLRAYEEEAEAREYGRLLSYAGSPESGLRNDFGWQLQGFIEDGEGRLRLETREEHLACMGCHGSIGGSVDHTFALARKVPGAEGWRPQTLVGMADAAPVGHHRGGVELYVERNGAGDEYRANRELRERWLPAGVLAAEALAAARPGGSRDLASLLLPSRERALALDRAYLGIVRAQSYRLGRDPVLGPVKSVFETVEDGQRTGLAEAGAVYRDAGPWLDWSRATPPPPGQGNR